MIRIRFVFVLFSAKNQLFYPMFRIFVVKLFKRRIFFSNSPSLLPELLETTSVFRYLSATQLAWRLDDF